MIERCCMVRKYWNLRLWTMAASCLASACFIQPAQGAYGPVPVFFFENRGQLASEDILYVAKGAELTGYFGSNHVLLALGSSTYRLTFPGSNPTPALQASQALGARVNFLFGAAGQWKTNLPAFGALAYRGLFAGVDLIYSTSGNRLKSDFIVAPGADPSVIRLRYEGNGKARIDADGALVIQGAAGEFRENAPLIYQEIDGKRVTVEGSFRVLPDGAVGFRIGFFVRAVPLVIDPVFSYGTYLGGSGMDSVTSIAVDGAGNSYLAGWTTSADLPTVSPVSAANSGGVDAFIAKLGPGGNTLVYCTYLGGRGDDRAFGIAVDAAGSAYVTGWTGSGASFPKVLPAQSTLAGGKDAFVAKLNPAGNALVYSTYLGGASNDSGNAIAVDAAGNAYVAGSTYSLNFPTANAYQSTNRGQQNAFVAKYNPSGSLLYSTYLGGNGSDSAAGIAIDSAGNAYVTGGTTSTNFPTAAPLQASSGGNQDAFITKLNPAGNGLIYSTYLGGSGGTAGAMEAGTAIAVDAAGAVYVAGTTSSTNFPVTAGALQATNLGGGSDAFVAKLNPAGSALVYSTYLGGSSVDYASGIAVDFVGNAYVTGYTASSDFLNLRAAQPGNAGPYDAFVAKLNPAGTGLVWSTYLGGSASDSANSVAVDSLCNVYVAGLSQSSDFPVRSPFQNLNGGSFGGFVTKVSAGWVAAVFLNGSWYIDRNRNGGFDGTVPGDQTFTFGQAGDIPVAGDWTGSGVFRVGVFRGGQWLLDCNGNGVWDNVAGGDCLYTFGQAGDKPVVGDWNGSGKTKIGVFRGGFWMLDVNGNGVFDGVLGGDNSFWFGNSTYTPVTGDWTGSGVTRTGLFLNGTWFLDANGDGQWVPGVDRSAFFGQAGDIPVTGDWSGSGKSNVGVFRTGFWILDMNGNGLQEGIGIGEVGFWLGNASFSPVVTR
jgi:hypothetical protein